MRKLTLLFSIILIANISFSQVLTEQTYKFSRVLSLAKTYYVDTVNEEQLVETAIIEMLKKLDPHSIYIGKEELKAMNEPLEGNFEGVGIQFNILDDTLMVVATISGGPSEKIGILAGDRIVKIDTSEIAGNGLKNSQVVKLLRGKKGTKVNVFIKRRGTTDLLDFTVTRDKIPIFSLDAAYMVDKNIGYIKLNRFAATSMKEYYEAMKKLQKQGVKDIILDLRGNGGGYLNIAIDLADQFLPEKKLLLFTNGENSPRNTYFSTKNSTFEKGRVVILVDEGSASASEIVSGAIQDWDRGLIIGRRTFGKGLVQRPFNLPDGTMIRLTIAKYYTPTGRCIQKPYKDGNKAYHKDLINRYNNGELNKEDSIHFPDSLRYNTKINERVVYGGGGIMPDIFVPLDTTLLTDYYVKLRRKGLINKTAIEYLDQNRAELKTKYKDFAKFKKDFEITDEILNHLVALGEKEKIEKDEEQFKESTDDFKLIIKALIARDLWNTSEFYQFINTEDKTFKKAVEVLKDKKLYDKRLQGKK